MDKQLSSWHKLKKLTDRWEELPDLPTGKSGEYFLSVKDPDMASHLKPVLGIEVWWTDEKWKTITCTAQWVVLRGKKSKLPRLIHGFAFHEYVAMIDEDDQEIIEEGIPYSKAKEFLDDIVASHRRLFEKGIIDENGFNLKSRCSCNQ